MENDEDYSVVIEWLQDRGHTPEEIDKILIRVREYEEKTQHDSIMDSIGAGRLNLDALISEVLDS